MPGDYKLRINTKVGDHLLCFDGDTVEEAVENLERGATFVARIHAALSILDGRDATTIVPKDNKTWGARSQGGRTYPKTTPGSGDPGQPTSAPSGEPSAESLLKSELGAVEVKEGPAPGDVPQDIQHCQLHNQNRHLFGPGKSIKTGKEYSSSYRCPERGCSAKWQQKDGGWS